MTKAEKYFNSDLYHKIMPYAETWDCYNDTPIEEYDSVMELIKIAFDLAKEAYEQGYGDGKMADGGSFEKWLEQKGYDFC